LPVFLFFEFEFKEGMDYNIPMVKIFEQVKKILDAWFKWCGKILG
jgi:hypothetical protein